MEKEILDSNLNCSQTTVLFGGPDRPTPRSFPLFPGVSPSEYLIKDGTGNPLETTVQSPSVHSVHSLYIRAK